MAPEQDSNNTNRKFTFIKCVIFVVPALIALTAFSVLVVNPTPTQQLIFRVVLGLVAAFLSIFIPGTIDVNPSSAVKATGAIAVFVLVYSFSPNLFPYTVEPDKHINVIINLDKTVKHIDLQLDKNSYFDELSLGAFSKIQGCNVISNQQIEATKKDKDERLHLGIYTSGSCFTGNINYIIDEIQIPGFAIFIGDVLDEEHEQNVVFVLAGIHAAAQFIARGPKGCVEIGFFYGHAVSS